MGMFWWFLLASTWVYSYLLWAVTHRSDPWVILPLNNPSEKLCSAQPSPCTQQSLIPPKADTEPWEANTSEQLLARGSYSEFAWWSWYDLHLVELMWSCLAAPEVLWRYKQDFSPTGALPKKYMRFFLTMEAISVNIKGGICLHQFLRSFDPQPQQQTLFFHSLL